MSEKPEKEKEVELKGVKPVDTTTPKAFREALDSLREHYRRSSENLTDISDGIDEKQIRIFLTNFLEYLEKHPSILKEIIREGENSSDF